MPLTNKSKIGSIYRLSSSSSCSWWPIRLSPLHSITYFKKQRKAYLAPTSLKKTLLFHLALLFFHPTSLGLFVRCPVTSERQTMDTPSSVLASLASQDHFAQHESNRRSEVERWQEGATLALREEGGRQQEQKAEDLGEIFGNYDDM